MLHCLQCTRVREIKPAHAKPVHPSLVLISSLISFLHGSHTHLSSQSMLMQKPPHFCCRNSPVLTGVLQRHQVPSHGICLLHLKSSLWPKSRVLKEDAFLCSLMIHKRGLPSCWLSQHSAHKSVQQESYRKERRGNKDAS